MLPKTASRTAAVWAYRLSCFAGAMWLINALASLTGWGNFANQPRSNGYFALAESVVFFSVGIVFKTSYRKAKRKPTED
jgi:hypothetical protein